MIIYRFIASEEQPAGAPERGLVVADGPEEAEALILAEFGEGSWVLERENEAGPDVEKGLAYIEQAPQRSPKMCANELFEIATTLATRTTFDPYSFGDLMPEIEPERVPFSGGDVGAGGVWVPEVSANTRVEQRFIYDPYIDGYRITELSALFLDGQPFAIGQEAGRGGRDHCRMFITDMTLYTEAVRHLQSLYQYEDPEEMDERIIDPSTPLRELTRFYNDDTMLREGGPEPTSPA